MEKVFIIRGLIVFTAVILMIRVTQLQLFDQSSRTSAQAAALSKQVQYPSRGLIFDRHGKLLVYNDAIYDILVVYNNVDPKMDTTLFCELLEITPAEFTINLNKDWNNPQFSKNVEYVFLSKVEPETYAKFQEHLFEFPGFRARLRNVRGYQHPGAAHVLGYINEVDQDFLDQHQDEYELGDFMGITGLEKSYESELKGEKGHKYILKDNLGREVGPYNEGRLDSSAVPGFDLITSLDIELQMYAEQLMQNKIGGIVALEPASGEILCMQSSPSWNPNDLTIHKERTQRFETLRTDSLDPFFDRTVMAQYPPGSIFKMVVGLVALQEEVSHPNRYIPCNGTYYNTRRDVRKCRDHPVPYTMSTALQFSCNSYFFELFKNVIDKYGANQAERGLDNFHNYLKNFGFGKPMSLDHVNEKPGFIPDSRYYSATHPNLRSPNIVSLGIGQGELQMTNLQMANLAAILANRGTFITPHLLKSFRNAPPKLSAKNLTKRSVRIAEHHFIPVIRGMEEVVRSGTGRSAKIENIAVCGKTGTVQNPHGEDHSVFIAFAPKDDPRIALVVYVENSGGGSRYAAPIAGLLIEKYLKKEISPAKEVLEQSLLETNLLPSFSTP